MTDCSLKKGKSEWYKHYRGFVLLFYVSILWHLGCMNEDMEWYNISYILEIGFRKWAGYNFYTTADKYLDVTRGTFYCALIGSEGFDKSNRTALWNTVAAKEFSQRMGDCMKCKWKGYEAKLSILWTAS